MDNLCEGCKNKAIARGIRFCECLNCKAETVVNVAFIDLCFNCATLLGKCQKCGKATGEV